MRPDWDEPAECTGPSSRQRGGELPGASSMASRPNRLSTIWSKARRHDRSQRGGQAQTDPTGACRAPLLGSIFLVLGLAILGVDQPGPFLVKQKLLDAQTFWDNRDWDWYQANIPFFECPDDAITTT